MCFSVVIDSDNSCSGCSGTRPVGQLEKFGFSSVFFPTATFFGICLTLCSFLAFLSNLRTFRTVSGIFLFSYLSVFGVVFRWPKCTISSTRLVTSSVCLTIYYSAYLSLLIKRAHVHGSRYLGSIEPLRKYNSQNYSQIREKWWSKQKSWQKYFKVDMFTLEANAIDGWRVW